MNSYGKSKNILDLKHNAALNFLNIFIILAVTSFITAFIGTRDYGFWTFNNIFGLSLIVLLVIMVSLMAFIFYSKEIIDRINKLKTKI
ncbi:hypothetical protein GF386_00930 [Candidatus Pacearchaeota archaeon]|nr:hypothetical protein [Candidatus Pacearchaeota archaeon]